MHMELRPAFSSTSRKRWQRLQGNALSTTHLANVQNATYQLKVQRQLAKHLDVCRYLNSLIALTKAAMQQHHRQRDARTTCVVLMQDVERASNQYEATHMTMHTPPPCFPFTLEDIAAATSDKHDETSATALAKLPCWLASLKDLHTTTRQAMWKL
jgi:hypothetical protein